MKRPNWVTNEQHWLADCAGAATVCYDYLSGALGLIEASRKITSYAHRLRETTDPDFSLFILIDSDSDHLPIGIYREGWNSNSLEKKDKEIQVIEEFYRQDAQLAAKTLLNKLKAAEQGAAANP